MFITSIIILFYVFNHISFQYQLLITLTLRSLQITLTLSGLYITLTLSGLYITLTSSGLQITSISISIISNNY